MLKKTKELSILIILIFPIFSSILSPYASFIRPQDIMNEKSEIPLSSDVIVGNYTIPGMSGPLGPEQVIKIGVLDDLNRTGEHTKNGALLAAKEINQAGGIEINASQYYIGITAENTDELNYTFNPQKVLTAMEELLAKDPHFIIGGSKNMPLDMYLGPIMSHKIPFIGTGCDSDYFCENVLYNYETYKYFFRGMPINETGKRSELESFIQTLALTLEGIYGETVDKIAFLREDEIWIDNIIMDLADFFSSHGFSIVEDVQCFPNDNLTDFETYMSDINSSGAQILIPLFSSEAGILMDIAYKNIKPMYLLTGINRHSEQGNHWDDTLGASQYEIIMQDTFRTNKTTLTIPFWDSYVNEYEMEPYFTGIGAYDAVRLLTHVVNVSQSVNPDIIVSELENVNRTNTFLGASGNIAFTDSHDLVEGWDYHNYLFCQWHFDGLKKVIPTWDTIYPDSIATGPLLLPYWGINDLVNETNLPGDFILSSDADNPDTDGDFNLTWTISEGADNYSLYMSDSYITYTSQDLDLISHQNDNTSVEMNNLKTGEHFFIVASYNRTGETLSNCIQVDVLRPSPGPFDLTTDADDPDSDGNFSLSWNSSEGADNYSVYKHSGLITVINASLEVLDYQTATSPFEISETADGIYYYVITATNGTGTTLSNSIFVNVTFPPPDHELVVYLEVPHPVKINHDYIINATVKNEGLNDENDVQLLLYLDEMVVDSIMVPFLSVGGSETIQYEWTPTEYDSYNFTTHSPPILGELIDSNNINTTLLYVSTIFDGLYMKYVWNQATTSVSGNYTYKEISGWLYEEIIGQEDMGSHVSTSWMLDSRTRVLSGGTSFPDGAHTPNWIFTNTSLYDTVLIGVPVDGDHAFFVAGDLIYNLPGFGPVDVWELEDLVTSGVAWYEKSTGILLNGTFFSTTAPVPYNNYTVDFIDTNADIILAIPPGDFTLTSTAGDPDLTGTFNLTWTEALQADNYSVYGYSSYITEINGSLALLADDITDLNLSLSGYTDGSYYFKVVAHNDYGDTLSNCLQVDVDLPIPPGDFTLTSTAGDPDPDGMFDISWTEAYKANNYSVYVHQSYITMINNSVTSLGDEISNLSLALSGYSDGTYYFIVVAHNIYGDTFSNCIQITVEIPPGEFTLSSNAGNPDNDGNFDLSWTASSNADSYSLYRFSSFITEINDSLTLLDDEITDLELALSGYENGKFYFIAVAHNEYGDKLSNCISVTVQKPVVPGYDLLVILGFTSITIFLLKKKNMRKILKF